MKSKFAKYAAETSKSPFVGDLIKYAKGEWQKGRKKDLISPDQRFVAIMDTLTAGWVKWVGGEPADYKMGLVADGFRPVHRNELGDLDSAAWEMSENGRELVDPWQRADMFVLASPTAPHDLYTFSTPSEGGRSAIRGLCAAHARTTEAVGKLPVVTLDTDSYDHKLYGRIHVPVFEVVDSVEAGPFNAMVAEARGGAAFIPASAPPPALEGPDRNAWNDTGRNAGDDTGAPPAPPPPTHEPEGSGEFDEPIPY